MWTIVDPNNRIKSGDTVSNIIWVSTVVAGAKSEENLVSPRKAGKKV